MNEHGTEAPDGTSTEAVRLDQGHIEGTGGIPERFTNPGLPAHIHRSADVDEKAARKAEKQVATLFTLSIIGTLVFIVAYFAIDHETKVFLPGIGLANLQNVVLGVSLAVSLFMIGVGAVHWAKTLMPDEEVVEERHALRSQDEDRTGAVDTILGGGDQAQLGRRPLIKYTLGGALGLFAVPLVLQVAGGLGPLPGDALSTTFWRKGMKLMRDPEATRTRPRMSRAAPSSTSCPRASTRASMSSRRRARPRSCSCASTRTTSRWPRSATGVTMGSWPTRRSAPTWVAPWASTSSRRTTCCAPATSPRST